MEIIPLDQTQSWNELVYSMQEYDFYFLNEYNQLDHSGIPVLLHYKDENNTILFPLVIREIEGTPYKDITSVYGYPGPLISNQSIDDKSRENFQKELLNFFDQENIVSAFSRLNPFLDQQEVLKGLGDIKFSNDTVSIDLSQSRKEIETGYSRTIRYQLRRLANNNLDITWAAQEKEILEYVEVYYENMKRVHASDYYFFSYEYFLKLCSLDSFELMVAKKDGKIIGGTLYSICNQFVQAHLNATKNDFLHLSPVKLIWNKLVDVGQDLGKKYLHLGGGYGGEDDSLFKFKSSFSKTHLSFYTWQYIHKKEAYDLLLKQKNTDKILQKTYFPSYRL